MPSLSFKDIELNQTTITGRRNPVVVLDSFRIRRKVDKETNQYTDEVDGYVADIVARNRIQSVKLPLDAVDDATVNQIQQAIESHKVVKINFGASASTLRGRCYALLNAGRILSGVSCTATELNVVSVEEPDDDFVDIDLDIID